MTVAYRTLEPVMRRCPVCLQLVRVRKIVFTHLDTVGYPCPMSGRIPVEGSIL
ncbi:hypothetical protein L5I01_17335 [Gordonia sp. HY442]|uniref:hypothetical protein n=1 Tax=Gordonia zhenghanii TaxID=2911516 RepID=UPI001F252CCC|nr:hypothetical protein [Gordonia zhenghanii]MCF8605120.1 hypothetical protein [Gordonia zhenghanii]